MADGQEKLGRMVPFVPSQVLLCRLVQSQTLFRGSRCSEFGGDGEGIMDPGGGLARPHPSRISHPLSLRRCWGEQRSLLIRHRGVCRCRHAGVGKACQGQQSPTMRMVGKDGTCNYLYLNTMFAKKPLVQSKEHSRELRLVGLPRQAL